MSETVHFSSVGSVQFSSVVHTTKPTTSIRDFINPMNGASNTRFVATYRLFNFLYLQSGNIVVTQIPGPPGASVKTNVDNYMGTGRFAYVFHGSTGRIVQWIEGGINASLCTGPPRIGLSSTGISGRLRCSRLRADSSPKGFAKQDVGFIQSYVLQSVRRLEEGLLHGKSTTTTTVSREFGTLRCLNQYSGSTTQTTCIDRAGFVVSWFLEDGSGYTSRVVLTSLNAHPTAKDFATSLKSAKSPNLPAA